MGNDKSEIMAKKKIVRIHLIVVLGYSLFVIINYWTLLSGNNYMKWDIMQAEYPLQVMMSDAIASGTLPLWNPLMNMGMPYYSVAGMPVWYPITLILACFGYTPWTISFEYTIHLFFAAYGMFLLTDSFLKGKKGNIVIAFITGLIYCSSGLFLSNAEHIMLVVSAAWFPYVFYYIKRYLEENRIIFLLLGAMFAGFIMSGGYPEMFYDLFMILVPYFLYIAWIKNKSIWNNFLAAMGKYILFCICTVLACAVTLLPFAHVMLYITRTANAEQAVCIIPFVNILSVILPKAGQILSNCEISMCNYYTSIIALIAVPCLSKNQSKRKWVLAGIAFFSFLMSWGEYSPLYMLCHKYLPMYAAFRFPSVFRPFVTIFLLLAVAETLVDMLYGQISKRSIFLTGGLVIWGIWGIWLFKRYKAGRITVPLWDTEPQGEAFLSGMIGLLIISIVYSVVLLMLRNQRINLNAKALIMITAVTFELFIFIQAEIPITITSYEAAAARSDPNIKSEVQSWYTENRERNRESNFSENLRSTTKYTWDTKYIVFGKTFDEGGYLSVKLETTEHYKQSFNRSIIAANPIAYFTNNIVDSSQVALADWYIQGNIPREQIHIDMLETNMELETEKETILIPANLAVAEGTINIDGNTISFEGNIPFDGAMARCINVWLQPTQSNICPVNICYEDITGMSVEYTNTYTVKRNGDKPYVEIFFPDPTQDYVKVTVSIQQDIPVNMDINYTEKMAKDNYVTVDYFSYNDISMNVQAPSDGYVVLLQSNYPGWNAYIDGQVAEIQTVDGCFIGLPIKQGNHQITLEFRPIDFFVGAGVSGTFLLALLIFAGKDIMAQKKENSI